MEQVQTASQGKAYRFSVEKVGDLNDAILRTNEKVARGVAVNDAVGDDGVGVTVCVCCHHLQDAGSRHEQTMPESC